MAATQNGISEARIKENLDKSLVLLADVLRKIGVEEMEISESRQQHSLNTDKLKEDPLIIKDFCLRIKQLHRDIIGNKS